MDLKSNEPFWMIKNGIFNSYPSLHEDKSCEVLVIGGGITGSLIAHQCIKDGKKTILIDKREIAHGSSSATTSMLQYEIDVPLYELSEKIGEKAAVMCYKACSDAIDQLQQVCKEIKSRAGFKKKESLYFAAFKKDVHGLKQEFEAREKAGFEVKWLTAEDIENQFEIPNSFGGILSQQGGSVDAFQLVHEILAYNVKKGLEVFDKTEMTSTRTYKGKNIISLKSGAKITADKVVYCIGYESTNLIKEKFVDLLSTYAIVSEVDEKLTKIYKDILLWNTADPYLYMRTTDDHRMLIGGEDEEFYNPEKRDEMLTKKAKILEQKFHKNFPKFTFREDFAWAGTFGSTKDGLPYIGTHKDFKNSYFVLGFGGNGITFSVTGMEMVSDWLHNKHHLLEKYFAFGR